MDIKLQNLPMAGQTLQFSVEGVVGKIKTEVFIDSKLILQNDCDDPPCHEMAMIPTGSLGSTLRIMATDNFGDKQTVEYKVADSDAGASGMISMEG